MRLRWPGIVGAVLPTSLGAQTGRGPYARPTLQGETLWYRMVAGGAAPRYVRLRPRPTLSAVLDGWSGQALPDGVDRLVARTTVEILTLRPTMSLGLGAPGRER